MEKRNVNPRGLWFGFVGFHWVVAVFPNQLRKLQIVFDVFKQFRVRSDAEMVTIQIQGVARQMVRRQRSARRFVVQCP